MKLLNSIFIFLTIIVGFSAYAQPNKFYLNINILPELKEIINTQNIRVRIFDSSGRYFSITNLDSVLIETSKDDSVLVLISSFINTKSYEREFSLFVGPIKLLKNEVPNIPITFPKDCPANRHVLDKICPKCNRKDKVIPILYGLRVPIMDQNGKILEKGPKKSYPGGCDEPECAPTWYCERNKLRF